jgi:hypothetical protein
MTNKSTPSKPRIPLPVNPEVEVVWNGATRSAWGEKGSLLPPTHNVGSTWQPSVNRLRKQIDTINEREIRRG